MIAVISPRKINGMITAPASKSAMQRACALALLNKGKTTIYNPGKSNDDLAAIDISTKLGAHFEYEQDHLLINSNGAINASGNISCGESGLSFRMFAALAALSKNEIVLTGEGSLLNRPMHFFDEVFPLLHIHTKTNKGFLPIHIKGPLLPCDIEVDGSLSSQYLTGLLFAFAKSAQQPVVIKVNDLKSKPYIDLSLQMLSHFGYKVNHENYTNFYIHPSNPAKKDIVYHTEGDWSGTSFLLVAGAIAGEVRVKGLDLFSAQADRVILDVLQLTGAAVKVEGSCVLVSNKNNLHAFQFDATDCPDLFPPLTVLAAYCKGISVITGVSRLAGKESNRAEALKDVFGKMGIEIILKGDDMIIKGGTGIHSANVSSHHDHRIAMAAAIAGLMATGEVCIEHAEAIDKSYPEFYRHLQMLGATVSLS